ncbi:sugar phosphate nucleotidyltransferase [Candidatus Neomarinimicrobiota bacterium]
MKVVIPVAGFGTRLKPHTEKVQKTLLPVAGKKIIDHILAPLFKHNIHDITFIIGHLGNQVVDHMKLYEGRFRFVEQKELLGLGHAILQGLEDKDEPVLVQLGDTIFNIDYSALINSMYNKILVAQVEDPSRFGIVELNGQDIINFYEKDPNPPSNWAISGLYYLKSEYRLKSAIEYLIKKNIQTNNEYQLTDALKIMLNDGEVFKIHPSEGYLDVGVPVDFLTANKALLKSDHGYFHNTDIIEPVFIGKNCEIQNSTIGPNVTIMDNCTIVDCHIENSIVLEKSQLNNNKINDKIVGEDGSKFC